MVSKPERDILRKIRHRHPRVIRPGEEFDAIDLERGDAVLEEVEPEGDIPESDQVEPWGWPRDKPMSGAITIALRTYRERFPEEDPDVNP